jgi:putative ABC transport system ATP-binding protein
VNLLEAKNLTQTYSIGDRRINVVEDVSLAVSAGEFLVIAGSSGSGKSTLLTLLSGLDRPASGKVFIHGQDITEMAEDDLAPLRNKTFGFVFQSFHLIPSLTALENVSFPAELRREPDALDRAVHLLDRVGLGARHMSFPHQLSGGEKQRVAICRALINDPEIIFADEPTGSLDSENGNAVLHLLLNLRQEQNAALILVTHSTDITALADRAVTLRDGRVIVSE